MQLAPLGRRNTASIRVPSLNVTIGVGGKAALTDSAVPDDLDARIAGERARQELERGEVATAHDDKSGFSAHCHALVDPCGSPRSPDRFGPARVSVDNRPQGLIEMLSAANE